MSTFTFSHGLPNYDWQQLMVQALGAGTVTDASPTAFTLLLADDGTGREVKIVFTGAAFEYDVGGLLTAGSFSGGDLIADDETVVTLTGYGFGNEPSFENYNNAIEVIRDPGSSPEDMDLAVAHWVQTEAATLIGSGEPEVLQSSLFNDTIDGNGGNDTIFGGSGADTINGGSGNDEVWGGSGDDELHGGDDNDSFTGGPGADTMDGGNGRDYISYQNESEIDPPGTMGVIVNLSDEEITGSATGQTGVLVAMHHAKDSFGDTDELISIERVRGTTLDDFLLGGNNDDWLRGDAGSDVVLGGGGNDTIIGGGGDDDIVDGQDGRDALVFEGTSPGDHVVVSVDGVGSGTVTGQDRFGSVNTSFEGIERIRGSIGDDSFTITESGRGTEFSDNFHLDDGNDATEDRHLAIRLVGGAGEDSFTDEANVYGGVALIDYRDEQSQHEGDAAGVVVNATDHDILLYENPSDPNEVTVTIEGGTARDTYGYTDTFAGVHAFKLSARSDLFVGGNDTYSVQGDAGDDLIESGSGRDDLSGGEDNDTINAGGGDDSLNGDDGDDELNGGAGNDYLRGGQGQDTIDGGADRDTVSYRGDHLEDNTPAPHGAIVNLSNDTITVPVSEDLSIDVAGSHAFDSFDNFDELHNIEDVDGSELDDYVVGSNEDNNLRGNGGNDYLEGGGGNDDLQGGEGDDTLIGGAGEDHFHGGSGADSMNGGSSGSDDFFVGGSGNDTMIGGGQHNRVNYEGETDPGNDDPGTLGVIVNLSGQEGDQFGAASLIDIGGRTLAELHAGEAFDSYGDRDSLTNIQNVSGSKYDDVIIGSADDSDFDGGDGNDYLFGGSGSNQYRGGAGNDTIIGGDGDDFAQGGDGDNSIDGGEGGYDNVEYHDQESGIVVHKTSTGAGWVETATGTDTFVNFEIVVGSDYADEFNGSAENDDFTGNGGADTFNGGGGFDTVVYEKEQYGPNGGSSHGVVVNLTSHQITDASATGIVDATVQAGTAIDAFGNIDVLNSIERIRGTDLNDLIIGRDDSFSDLDGGGGNDWVQAGAYVAENQNNQSSSLSGGDGDDTLTGGEGSDNLDAGAGDDVIDAKGGQFDYINGSSGAGTVDGGDGYDMIGFKGENPLDHIHVVLNTNGLGTGTITGEFSDIWIDGEPTAGTVNTNFVNLERVVGTAGVDTFVNGGFNPTASAEWVFGDRSATPFTAFSFVGGAGNDTFTDTTGTSTATVIDYDEEKYSHGNYDNHVWGSQPGELGVAINFSGSDIVADGDTIVSGTARDTFGDTDTITGVAAFRLTAANDTFYAGNGKDFEADGREGDDLLVGGDGSDLLIGDRGNDTLAGGAGNDTLWLGQGDDSATGGTGSDTFELSTGVDTITDFSASDGDHISLSWFDSIQSLQDLLDHLVDPDNHDDVVLDFGGGNITTLTGVDYDTLSEDNLIFYEVQTIDGTPGNDNPLEGTDAGEVINGLGGNDWIYAHGGNDTVHGGEGDDRLFGGQGDDVLNGGEGNDRIDYDQDNNAGDGRGVIVNLSDITIVGAEAEGQGPRDVAGQTAIDGFGDTDTLIDIEGARGTSYNDLLVGNDDRNYLQGKAGDDTIIGAGGDDLLRGDAGHDEIHGGSGFDMLSNETLNSADHVTVTFSSTEAGAGAMTGERGGVGVIDSQFDGIEAVRSWSGNDTFIAAAGTEGTGDSDRFYIDDGIDGNYDEYNSIRVSGGRGNDTFTDQTEHGVLFVDYREDREADGGAPNGVWVNVSDNEMEGVAAHTALDPFGDTDTLNGVRAFQLTDLGDVFQALDSDTSFHVRAGGGNDYIQGGNGNDTLNGDDGDDTIYGGAGKEDIQGGDGDDLIYSGDGDHNPDNNQGGSIHGGRGNDTIYGGDGNEFINISWGDDVIDGDGGNDMLAIRRVNDGDNNEPSHDGDHIDVIFGGPGQGAGNIAGEYGEEAMSVVFSNIERVRGSGGDDTFTATVDATPTSDSQDFYLSDGDDQTDDRHHGINVIGGDGADTFTDNSGVHGGILIVDYQEEKWTHDDFNGGAFGNGTSQFGVIVNMSAIEQDGVAGGTALDTFGNIDTISGVHAFRLSDTSDKFYAGNDGYAVQAADGDDTLIGGTGDDNLSGDEGNDSIVGGDGNDWLGGWTGNDTLIGGDGDDNMEGDGGHDSMVGGAGNDWFRGGAGNDYMDGGDEDDKVQYRDERDDNGNNGTQGVIVNLTDDDITADLNDGNGEQTVAGHRAKDSFGDTDTLVSISNVEGTDNADYIIGDNGFNELVGNGGNDTLIGGEGEGQFDGGDGNDLMIGGSSDDFFRAGRGDDTIDGGTGGHEYDNLEYYDAEDGITVDKTSSGAGTVIGDWAGTDTFTNIEIVVGTAFADEFNGSSENDDFTGFKGNDTFNGGDGFDRIVYDKERRGDEDVEAHGVVVNLSSQAITAGAQGVDETTVAAGHAIDAHGDIDELNSIESIEGTDLGDYLQGSDTSFSELHGREGDDTIVAGAFDGQGNNANYLEGGRGDDSIVGGNFNDQISAGSGDDVVLAGGGGDYIRGSAGGADSVDGGDGYDMIGFGGIAGDLDGNGISVTFDLTGVAGGGLITGEIHDYDQNEGSVHTAFEDIERIEGTNADDVFQLVGDGFVNGSNSGVVFVDYLGGVRGQEGVFDLSGGGGDDSFTDLSTAEGGVLLVSYEGERWAHSDYDGGHVWGSEPGEHGVVINFSNDEQNALGFDLNDGNGPDDYVSAANTGLDTYGDLDSYNGIRMTWLTAADDWLWASDAGTFAYGERGNDHLFGGAGNDMLVGGEGNDTLSAGGGQDTLTYAMDSMATANGVIVNLSDSDEIVGAVLVASGTARDNWGHTDVVSGFEIVVGTTHGDTIFGATGQSTILIGGSGDDLMVGGAANDVLRGDQGNDTLRGGDGTDTVDYHREVLSNTAEWPYPGEDNAPRAGVIVNLSAGNLVVGGDTIDAGTARDSFGTLDQLEEIENVDGSEFGDVVLGSSGNNLIRGFEGNDTLRGGGGDDTIYGGDGDDTIVFESGTLTVADFAAGGTDDRIDLTAFATVNDLGELFALLVNPDDHSNAIFNINGQLLTLTDVNFSNLTASDFVFSEVTNQAPIITSNGGGEAASIYMAENSTTLVTTVVATDADLDAIEYRIVGGGDATLFNINPATGELRFVIAPDFENPADENADNVYSVLVEAWDGTHADLQTLTIVVTDSTTGVVINGTAGDDVVNSGQTVAGQPLPTNEGDLIYGYGGSDTLSGMGGNDTIDGGAGADTMVGGIGDDTYVVDVAGDVVTEQVGEGTDTIQSWISLTLGANIENLELLGAGVKNGTGNSLNNMITGNASSNVLDGGAGTDTLIGGSGDDTYYVDVSGDVVTEQIGGGNDTVYSTASSYTLGNEIETLVLLSGAISGIGNGSNNTITGNGLANSLSGMGGNDTIDGGAGADTMVGGIGDDTYVVDVAGDVVTEQVGEGTDTIQSWISLTLGANIENLELLGAGVKNGTGNSLNNMITGNASSNVLDGGAGTDTLIGGSGDDTYYVDVSGDVVTEQIGGGNDTVYSTASSYTLGNEIETLVLLSGAISGIGNGSNNTITGNGLANSLSGMGGNDTIDGGAGADTMVGGIGDDTYVVDVAGDVVTEQVGEGTDTIQSWISLTLGANIENLELLGAGVKNGTGNSLNNMITGNASSNVLDGGAGTDTLIGGSGDDTYYVDVSGDVVTEQIGGGNDTVYSTASSYTLGNEIETLVLLSGAISGIGNGSNNTITGNGLANSLSGMGGNDTIDGGAGADTMVGGIGDDTYVVDVAGDVVTEQVGEGTDTIQSWISLTLGANIENLELLGAGVKNGTGNSLNNMITGNASSNVLDGGAGTDTLIGGSGDDTYYVDVSGDVVTEQIGGGNDTVYSTASSYTLGNEIETLVLLSGAISGIGNGSNNTITGNGLANSLSGMGGNDTIDGGAGADTMVGGIGDDTYVVDVAGDVVTEQVGEGTDTIQSWISLTLGANIENLELLGAGVKNGTGNSLNNMITGNASSNVLDGGAGTDTLIGGSGDDTYYVDVSGDVVTEQIGGGNDTVYSTASSYTLGNEIETLVLLSGAISGIGNGSNNTITGNGLANSLSGMGGNDTIDGGAGADTMVGGIGDDTYVVDVAGDVVTEQVGEGTDTIQSWISLTLGANIENLELLGAGVKNGTGNSLNNMITGNASSNVLDGGAGTDTLIGGSGDDTYYVDVSGDVVTEQIGGGNDTVYSTASSYTLGNEIETLVLLSGAISGIGNGSNNTITGNGLANSLSGMGGNDTIDGGAGADTMVGGIGDDTYVVDVAGDVVTEQVGEGTDTIQSWISLTLGANIENLELLGAGVKNGTGNSLNNMITGNASSNVLDGGAGTDTLIGGSGDDTYYVDVSGDVVTEQIGGGNDTVYSTASSYTLGNEIETLVLLSGAISGIGNGSNNTITGNGLANSLSGMGGNDTIDGGAGADTMVGGIGDDTYVVDVAGDVVTEQVGEGTDTIQSWISLTLGANIENLELLGAGVKNGTGNSLNNMITGNASSNVLDGGAGTDTLIGGSGDDTYYVDVSGDVVTEQIGGGNDTVYSTASSYTLGNEIETLVLLSGAISGIGNGSNNTITGNGLANSLSGMGGNDTIDGGAGADTMVGGIGDDTYVVDVAGDVVTEQVGEGTDTIQSWISLTLGANIENLELLGAGVKNGTGNSLNNMITGNSAANVLDGGAGNDTMVGGGGDDTYIVDAAGDVVTELVAGGNDTIKSWITLTLADNVENLELLGVGAKDGTGNTLDNRIVGNSGVNVLDGGLGADTLTGGAGNDTFVFRTASSPSNADTVTDFTAGDKLAFASSVFGILTADNFVFGTAAGDTDDRLIYDSASGILLYDADGNGGGAAVTVATFSNHYALAWEDLTFL